MTLLVALVALPALGALGAAAHRSEARRTGWLVAVTALHLVLTGLAWAGESPPALGGWLALDAIGRLVLTVVSLLSMATAVYAVGYLKRETPRGGRAFVSCLLAFLSAASLVALSHHFALLWIGLEATTLAVAPLIFHRHDRHSLEAVWKYLMLSSVGIALALLGTFLLAAAQSAAGGTGRPLVLEDLLAAATTLHPAWLKAACIFLLVGYGTKMGLVPLHSWKPDTYGVAPSLVAALMAGALTVCAFLGLVRITQIMVAAGLRPFETPLLLTFGLGSLAAGAVFILGQRDLKRMLAWSSIEHMGLLTLGLGIGGASSYGTLLHVLNNGLAKGLLFLTAGNVILAAGRDPDGQRGLLRRVPVTAILLLVGLLGVAGSPPFGTFRSELAIVRGAFGTGHPWIGGTALSCLALSFVGMARLIVPMVYAPPAAGAPHGRIRESAWLLAAPVALALGLLALGLVVPAELERQLVAGATALGGHGP